jgi:hypothetical protein
MKYLSAIGITVASGLLHQASAQEVAGDAAVQNQWFTGTLEAPSPALPAPGILEVEPYAIFTRNDGAYDTKGDFHSAPDVDVFSSVTLFKYGLTDRISVQALLPISHLSSSVGHYSGIGDLPVEIEYRFNDQNNKTGFPSVTASLGLTLPTGDYDGLRTPVSGFGAGAYSLKEGLLFQSLFDTWGHHPMRFRVYGAAYEPLGVTSLNNVSIYGTGQGFHGRVGPGFSAVLGIGGGYAFDQNWVLALDLVYNYAHGFQLNGTDATNGVVLSHSGRSTTTALAPAIEYNLSDNVGVIAGIEFTAGGHNSTAYFAPQIALSVGF